MLQLATASNTLILFMLFALQLQVSCIRQFVVATHFFVAKFNRKHFVMHVNQLFLTEFTLFLLQFPGIISASSLSNFRIERYRVPINHIECKNGFINSRKSGNFEITISFYGEKKRNFLNEENS